MLDGTVSGDIEAVPPTLKLGKQAFLRFDYPGDNSTVLLRVDITPGDPGAAGNAGFRVYGPTNGKLYATGGQTGRRPSHAVELASTEAGTYLVEIYNANVVPVHYEASAIGLPPQAEPSASGVRAAEPARVVAAPTPPPVPIGQNTSAEKAAALGTQLVATLAGSSSGSFHFYRFDYPGDGSAVTIDLDVTPSDAQTAQNAGFVVYGPTAGREYTRGGYQGRSPTHSTALIATEPGVYLVQVFNYGPIPIGYRLSATGLRTLGARPAPAATKTAAGPTGPSPVAAADPVAVGTEVPSARSLELAGSVAAVPIGGYVGGSPRRVE